jgi:hypothetical protein
MPCFHILHLRSYIILLSEIRILDRMPAIIDSMAIDQIPKSKRYLLVYLNQG